MTENFPGTPDGRPDGEQPIGPDSGAASSHQPPSDVPPGTGDTPSDPPPADSLFADRLSGPEPSDAVPSHDSSAADTPRSGLPTQSAPAVPQAQPDPDVTQVTRTSPAAAYQPEYPQQRPAEQQPSGAIPVAHVPQSQWSPGGQQQPPPQQQQYIPPAAPHTGQQAAYQSGYHQAVAPPYATYAQQTGPLTSSFPAGGLPPEPPKRRTTGLVLGIALLALVIGGAAGGLGGYLVSTNDSGDVISSLDQSSPANQTANAPAGSVQSVATKVLPVVVTIAAEFQSQGNLSGDTGSGVIITSNGDILTNNHVIADAATAGGKIQVIFQNGKTVTATVVGRDPTTDIAVIKADNVSGLPVAQLGSAANLTVGQDVVAIGAPFELSGTVTSGIVSSLHRPTEAGDGSDTSQTTVLDAIQTDAPINPGNSGGPLVNMQGQVVGINSAIYSPNSGSGLQQSQGGNVGIGFAIPIDQARRTADQIVKTGKATQTVLGVQVQDNTPTQNGEPSILPNGALIKAVTPNGPAAKGGLQAGAVVVKADGRLVTSSDGLVAAVHAAAPGDKMTLTLANGSTVTVTLSGQTVNPN